MGWSVSHMLDFFIEPTVDQVAECKKHCMQPGKAAHLKLFLQSKEPT